MRSRGDLDQGDRPPPHTSTCVHAHANSWPCPFLFFIRLTQPWDELLAWKTHLLSWAGGGGRTGCPMDSRSSFAVQYRVVCRCNCVCERPSLARVAPKCKQMFYKRVFLIQFGWRIERRTAKDDPKRIRKTIESSSVVKQNVTKWSQHVRHTHKWSVLVSCSLFCTLAVVKLFRRKRN